MERNYGGDRERCIHRGDGWDKFRTFIAGQNPDLDVDKILMRTKLNREPVISYGIIEFVRGTTTYASNSQNPNDSKTLRCSDFNATESRPCILYHVFRRRNTTEYDILIRGFAQKNQLYDLITLLSRDERERILNNTWEDIWDDYWIDQAGSGYTALKSQSKRRFPEIKTLLQLINDDIPYKINERPFIFPKGRPNKNETGLEAALREAREETRDDFMDGYLYFRSPIVQHYIGSDDRQYTDYYYVWCRNNVYGCPVLSLNSPPNSPPKTISRKASTSSPRSAVSSPTNLSSPASLSSSEDIDTSIVSSSTSNLARTSGSNSVVTPSYAATASSAVTPKSKKRHSKPVSTPSRWDILLKKVNANVDIADINSFIAEFDNNDNTASNSNTSSTGYNTANTTQKDTFSPRQKDTHTSSPRGYSPKKNPKPRLRNTTISHELESDAWIEIPIFSSVKEQLEWQNTISSYAEFRMFKRHFSAILEIHSHLC